jgi:hypothetical protein
MRKIIVLFHFLIKIFQLRAGHILDSACDPISNLDSTHIYKSTNTTDVIKYNEEYQMNRTEKYF